MSNDHPHGTLKSDIKTVKKPLSDEGEIEALAKKASGNMPKDAGPK